MCEFSLDENDAGKINSSSKLNIKIPGNDNTVDGKISRIYKKQGDSLLTAELEIDSQEELAGMSANIAIETYSEEYKCLVNNAAIKKDASSYYIFVIKENKDLRNDYTIKRVDMRLIESDENYTAIKGMDYLEPVVVESSKDIFNGNKVRYGSTNSN